MNSKMKKSFTPKKPKTAQEIDDLYQQHAMNAGHKAALAQKLLREVEQHHDAMFGLSKDGVALQKAAAEPTPAPIPPNPTLGADTLGSEQEHA